MSEQTGYLCKWCKCRHKTIYDCVMADIILPPDIPYKPAAFGRLLKMLLEPTEDDLKTFEHIKKGETNGTQRA